MKTKITLNIKKYANLKSFQCKEQWYLAKYIAIFLLAIVCLSLGSTSSLLQSFEVSKYVNNAYGFSIIPPSGWSTQEAAAVDKNTPIVVFIGEYEERFAPTINIMRDSLHGLSFDDYAKAAKESVVNDLSSHNYLLIGWKKKEVNNMLAYEHIYTFTFEGKILKADQYFFATNTTGFAITYTALPHAYDKYSKDFNQSILSFKLKNGLLASSPVQAHTAQMLKDLYKELNNSIMGLLDTLNRIESGTISDAAAMKQIKQGGKEAIEILKDLKKLNISELGSQKTAKTLKIASILEFKAAKIAVKSLGSFGDERSSYINSAVNHIVRAQSLMSKLF